MNKDKYLVIRGELYYAKLTGKARPHTGLPKYDKGPYWSVDVSPNAESKKLMEEFGILDKLKKDKKDPKRPPFLGLRHLLKNKDGSENNPPTVKDSAGDPWDERLLGNGTIADVKVKIKDYGPGSEKGVYLQAVRILKLVPYEKVDFEPLSEDDEFFAGATDEQPVAESSAFDPDLDDDVPFNSGN